MANKKYIERVKMVVEHLHNCAAVHSHTKPVHEIFKGQTVWEGDVEVFNLTGHAKAKRAYAWSHRSGKDDSDEKFVAVLEIPPVNSVETAVRLHIVAESNRSR